MLQSGSGFDDMNLETAQNMHVTATIEMSSEENEGGDFLVSKREQKFPLVPFPIDVMPGIFRDISLEYSKTLQVSPKLIAMSMIAIASGTTGNSVVTQAKKGYEVPPFMWLMIIADSGYGKSHSIQAVMAPVKRMQGIEEKKHADASREYSKGVAECKRSKTDTGLLHPPEPMRDLYTSDFTIESLLPIYANNSRGIIIHVDELAGLMKSFNQYKGTGNDKEQIIQLFDAKDLKINRRSGTEFVRNSGAAIIGGIQGGILNSVFSATDFVNGLAYRFLPLIEKPNPTFFTLEEISDESVRAWQDFIAWTYEIPLKTDVETGKVVPIRLSLTSESLGKWTAFYDRYQAERLFMPSAFRGYLPKLVTYALKFMAVIHLMRSYLANASTTQIPTEIGPDTVENAIQLSDYFAGQALALVNGRTKEESILEAVVRTAVESLHQEVDGGRLLLARVVERTNELLPGDMRMKEPGANKQVASILRGMGMTVTTGTGNKTYLIWEPGKLFK